MTPSELRDLADRLEDGELPAEEGIPLLEEALRHTSASMRLAAVEGLWQCLATGSAPAIAAQHAIEPHPEVKQTMADVLWVFSWPGSDHPTQGNP